MINYLADKDDMQGIKQYLGKIPIVEGTALITIPQKEWLGALIYSKAEKAKKLGRIESVFIPTFSFAEDLP
mgnify:CR=1 FL=1